MLSYKQYKAWLCIIYFTYYHDSHYNMLGHIGVENAVFVTMLEHIGMENAAFVTILFLLGRFYLICHLEYHSCTPFEIEQQWCIVQRASQLDND